MRRLAALAVVLAAFVVALYYVTSGGTSATTDAGGDAENRTVATRALALTDARDVTTAPQDAEPRDEPRDAERAVIVPRSTSIEGVVRTTAGDVVPDALVGLFAPARVDDADASRWAPVPEHGGRDDVRIVRSWTKSDAYGRFRFEDPEPGTWIVRAELGPLLAAATRPFALVEHASRTDLVVELPEPAWLEGSVIVPDERSLRGVGLELRPKHAPSMAPWSPTEGVEIVGERCLPDLERRFRLGPVEAGTHVVGVVIDPSIESRGNVLAFGGVVAPVLELDLPPGTTQRDIDLHSGLPGTIVADLVVDTFDPARPERSFREDGDGFDTFVLVRADEPDTSRAFQRPFDFLRYTHELGECGPLAPGRWRVDTLRQGWRWTLAPAVHVGPSDRIEMRFALRVARTDVQFVDAETSEPLPRVLLQMRAERATDRVVSLATDAGGRIDLALPPDEYHFTAQDGEFDEIALDPKAFARLSWNEDGPKEFVVRLAPPPPQKERVIDLRSGRTRFHPGIDVSKGATEFRTDPKR